MKPVPWRIVPVVEAAAVVEATEAAEAAATVVVAVDTAVVAAATVVVAVDTVTVTAVATRTEGPVRTTAKSLTDFFQETARSNPGRFSF
jgi:predicted RNase H-like nuclease